MSCFVLWTQIYRKSIEIYRNRKTISIPYWELKQKKSKQPEKQTEESKQSYESIVLKKNALMLHSLFNHIISKLPAEGAKKNSSFPYQAKQRPGRTTQTSMKKNWPDVLIQNCERFILKRKKKWPDVLIQIKFCYQIKIIL